MLGAYLKGQSAGRCVRIYRDRVQADVGCIFKGTECRQMFSQNVIQTTIRCSHKKACSTTTCFRDFFLVCLFVCLFVH